MKVCIGTDCGKRNYWNRIVTWAEGVWSNRGSPGLPMRLLPFRHPGLTPILLRRNIPLAVAVPCGGSDSGLPGKSPPAQLKDTPTHLTGRQLVI